MFNNLSLTKKFSALLALFSSITMVVLFLMVKAKDEPIEFSKQELLGNIYQLPVEKALHALSTHQILAQRALHGDTQSAAKLSEIQSQIESALSDIHAVDEKIGESLQFTDKGLASRKRERASVANVSREWKELKGKVSNLEPAASNEMHAQLIADLKLMIAQLGDTSNLILDPDLDSYYLMDVTLLALPQAQDRIRSATVELEPLVRRKTLSIEDRIKIKVYAAMMKESDAERIKGDFQTVLNEDPNFYGKQESLSTKLAPINQKFLASYQELYELLDTLASGQPVDVERFTATSETALNQSFEYWYSAQSELDKLLLNRGEVLQSGKIQISIVSVLCLLFSLGIAWFFVRYLVRNMRNIVTILNQSSGEVSGASAQSAASAATLSEASTEQAASLQETMASVEQISAMVSQNAESAVKTKVAVDSNQKVSEDGSQSVVEMLRAISEIKASNVETLAQMESSNREFGEIVKIITEIAEKTNVINEIVFQTKLLSFNASVEAARAGEHGKGFAVVAEEVGNLAQMSGNAAKEITEMLSASVRKVNDIVQRTHSRVDQLVEVGRDKIAVGESTAQQCKEALSKITKNAGAMAEMIAEITHASKEQAQGIQEINKAISQLDQVTQQNTTVAAESSEQAKQLESEAGSLADAVLKLMAFVDGGANANAAETEATPAPAVQTQGKVTALFKKAVKPVTPRKKVSGEDSGHGSTPKFDEF